MGDEQPIVARIAREAPDHSGSAVRDENRRLLNALNDVYTEPHTVGDGFLRMAARAVFESVDSEPWSDDALTLVSGPTPQP